MAVGVLVVGRGAVVGEIAIGRILAVALAAAGLCEAIATVCLDDDTAVAIGLILAVFGASFEALL